MIRRLWETRSETVQTNAPANKEWLERGDRLQEFRDKGKLHIIRPVNQCMANRGNFKQRVRRGRSSK